MGLSLNPADVFKIFFERHDKDLARTIAYMESVVAAAHELEDVWYKTYQRLTDEDAVKLIPDGVMGWNISPYRRLEEFYRVTSSVLWKHPDANRSFLDGLASLMIQRSITKKAYEEVVRQSRNALFLDNANRHEKLEDIRKGVEAMQREVAALDVVLAHFRAVSK